MEDYTPFIFNALHEVPFVEGVQFNRKQLLIFVEWSRRPTENQRKAVHKGLPPSASFSVVHRWTNADGTTQQENADGLK
jgi:hypothetical protein